MVENKDKVFSNTVINWLACNVSTHYINKRGEIYEID